MNIQGVFGQELLGGKVQVLSCDRIEDRRGSLTPVNLEDLGFDAKRIAVIQSFDGGRRGGHAHRTGSQLLLCTRGRVHVELRHGAQHAEVELRPGENALLIHAPVWARQTYRGNEPCLVVISDMPFDRDAYIGMECETLDTQSAGE